MVVISSILYVHTLRGVKQYDRLKGVKLYYGFEGLSCMYSRVKLCVGCIAGEGQW